MRKNFPGAIVAGLIVVGFCAILFAHDPLLFWNDDYELSILPVFADVARSWSEGHLPLLSPFSWVCANLAGEFQYGTFSIFINAIVVLIWKFPLTFSQQAAALSITHLFILASGAFVVARSFSTGRPTASPVDRVSSAQSPQGPRSGRTRNVDGRLDPGSPAHDARLEDRGYRRNGTDALYVALRYGGEKNPRVLEEFRQAVNGLR